MSSYQLDINDSIKEAAKEGVLHKNVFLKISQN